MRLQSMGAQVYPPGRKETMDWEMLAGVLREGAVVL